MDPSKPLSAGNIIPQCQKCNRGDRNRWVYDEKGRVIKLIQTHLVLRHSPAQKSALYANLLSAFVLANPQVIKSCDRAVRAAAYRILYKEFKGANPLE